VRHVSLLPFSSAGKGKRRERPRPRRLGALLVGRTQRAKLECLCLAVNEEEYVEPVKENLPDEVSVSVASLPSRNLRELTAVTRINAPAESVWDTLTSYETLHEFIPGLAVNECLERTESGATLLQIGEANTAVGFRFKARVLLDIGEYPQGVPEGHIFRLESDATESVRDITFSQIEGDFKEYEGTWKILGNEGEGTSKLVYILRVKPQPWLPVSLVMRKVSQEVKINLSCVRMQAEAK